MRRNTRREGRKRKEEKMASSLFRVFPFFIRLLFLPPSPVLALSLPFLSLSPSFRQAIKNGSFFVPFAPSLWAQGSNIGGLRSSQRIACMHPNKIFFFGGRGKDRNAELYFERQRNFFKYQILLWFFRTFLSKN